MDKYIELIDKYRIEQGEGDYNPPSYVWVDNTGEIVRCGRCRWWSEPVDEVDGKLYGQCERPITAIKHTSLVSSTWYCADGERGVQE